jgi:heat shock protein HslJ
MDMETGSSLKFTEPGKVSGSAGCRDFNGTVEVKGNSIRFESLTTTERSCEPLPDDQQEQYIAALEKTRSYSLPGARLSLMDKNGDVLVRFYALGTAPY